MHKTSPPPQADRATGLVPKEDAYPQAAPSTLLTTPPACLPARGCVPGICALLFVPTCAPRCQCHHGVPELIQKRRMTLGAVKRCAVQGSPGSKLQPQLFHSLAVWLRAGSSLDCCFLSHQYGLVFKADGMISRCRKNQAVSGHSENLSSFPLPPCPNSCVT